MANANKSFVFREIQFDKTTYLSEKSCFERINFSLKSTAL